MITYSVHDLADDIFGTEFEYNSGHVQFYYLSGWLNNNIGRLNTRIDTSFCVESGLFTPTGDFGLEERSIYKQMYLHQFYTKKATQVLRGTDSSVDFLTLREGDTVITRTNKNELAKTYKSMASDAMEETEKLITSYKLYQAAPLQVVGNIFSTGSCSY